MTEKEKASAERIRRILMITSSDQPDPVMLKSIEAIGEILFSVPAQEGFVFLVRLMDGVELGSQYSSEAEKALRECEECYKA